MSNPDILLDNVVLSAFAYAGWFENLEFWAEDRTLYVPQRVWSQEFEPMSDLEKPPDWISCKAIENPIEPDQPGRLSDCDWSCCIVADDQDAVLVTRDRALKKTAEQRGITTMWAAKFMKTTFESCGISITEYEKGLPLWIDDGYPPQEVKSMLKNAEKDSVS